MSQLTPRPPPKGDPGLTLVEMKRFWKDHFEDFVNMKKAEVALVNFSTDFKQLSC